MKARKWIAMGFFFLISYSGLGQENDIPLQEEPSKPGKVKEKRTIEIRKVERKKDGNPIGGTIPDSLKMKYFIDSEGTIYKHFNRLEPALAHYRGYHHRPLATAEEEIIYVSNIIQPKENFGLDLNLRKNSFLLEYDLKDGRFSKK